MFVSKHFKKTAIKIPKTALIILSLIFAFGCNSNYLEYSQHIKSPDGRFNYCLYFDGVGIGDPGYYVLKLENNISPQKLWINYNFKTGTKPEEMDWIDKRQLLFNYDEAGFLTSNPKFELINNRHLVFSRGGYYFGLYDLKLKKDTFDISSPWNAWLEKSGYKSEKYDQEKEQKAYELWIKKNINDKIKNYILTNK